MLDLYHASRDELIRLILAQQDVLAEQERRLTALATQLTVAQATIARLTEQFGALVATDDAPDGGASSKGMPGLKPTEPPERTSRPRRKRATSAARHRMTPTARVVHALTVCPDCGAPLAGGTIKRTREVIELPRRRSSSPNTSISSDAVRIVASGACRLPR